MTLLGRQLSTVCLADTGSDINLISAMYLKQLMRSDWHKVKELIQPSYIQVSSFSNDRIPLKGVMDIEIKFVEHEHYRRVRFHIIREDINVSCPIIIGIKTMSAFRLEIRYKQKKNVNIPAVNTFHHQQFVPVPSYYLTDEEFSRSITKPLTLKPGESKRTIFYLSESSPFQQSSSVVLTSDHSNPSHILVVNTKGPLNRCNQTGRLYASGAVINAGNDQFSGQICGQLEDALYYKSYELKSQNKAKILKHRAFMDLDIIDNGHFQYDGKFVLNDDQLLHDQKTASVNYIKVNTEPTPHVNLVKPISFPENQHVGQNLTAINNDVANLNESLTEERHNIQLDPPLPPDEASKYHDPKTAVNLGIQDLQDENFNQEILAHKGYFIPDSEKRQAADVIADLDVADDVRPYLEDIFSKYENTVSLNSMHRGNLTKYLGRYKLELKPGAQLPQHKRIYYLAPTESQLMKSILEFMISNGTIEAASPRGDNLDKFSCSSFLVPRSDKNAIGRLVVDYSLLNKCLKQEPPAIPTLDHILSELRGSSFYTNLDLSQAFYSIELHPDSREYTRFSTQFGFFNFRCLPTGVHSSPSLLERVLNHIVHYEIVRDSDGNVVWENEAEHIAKLKYSPLKNIQIFFDDLLVHTPWMGTYEKSRDFHFQVLEQLVERISVHEGRLNLVKSTFYKTRLTYLGWNVSRNHVSVDQRRVQKVLDFNLPQSTKGWRSFLGTCNSLRLALGYDCLKHVTTLSSLSSSKNKAPPTDKQIAAFHSLKEQLTKAPLFCSIVLPASPKIVFVDSSQSREGSFAAVICQITTPKEDKEYIPTYLNLADAAHRLILDYDLPCIPAPWIDNKETDKEYKLRVNIDLPPEYRYLESSFCGLSREEFPFTITKSLKSLFVIHSCSSDFFDVCRSVSSELRQGMLRQQILDFSFNNNKQRFTEFIADLQNGNIGYDSGLFFFEALAKVLQRPITIVSALPCHSDKPIKVFNHDKKKPMFYFFLIETKDGVVFRPGYLDKDQCYKISKHRGSLEVIGYLSKTLPAPMRSQHILTLELYAILVGLHHFKKYIGTSELLVIGDAKCLFYAYNDDVQETSTKLNRWTSRILDNFPNLRLGFCKSSDNICDFLSKSFDIKPPTMSLLKLPNFVSDAVTDLVDQRIFTIPEWQEFVRQHPDLIDHIDSPELRQQATVSYISSLIDSECREYHPLLGHDEHVLAINRVNDAPPNETQASAAENLKTVSKPIQILADILSPETIQPRQRDEYKELYEKALTSHNQEFEDKSITYSLQNGQLFRRSKGVLKLMIPPSLLPAIISYTHLRTGHAGFKRMMLNLEPYYCAELRLKTERFCRACLPCALVNVKTSAEILATYPLPGQPFITAHLDYVEAFPPIRGFNHLLICTDILTGMVLLYPTKGKTAEEFLRVYLYGIQQHYKVRNLLTDNAKQFVAKSTVSTLQALGIRTIHTSSLSPQSKGNVERQVRNVKEATKKMLIACDDYSWLMIIPYFTIMYNSSKLPRHGQSPFEMLYGKNSRLAEGVWPLIDYTPKPHPVIARSSEAVAAEKDKIRQILDKTQQQLDQDREERNAKLNKNRTSMNLQKGDIVLAKNHQVRPGTTLPLKSRYHLSLYTVISPRSTTTMVRRELDDFVTVLHNSELKKFVPLDPEFSDLPKEVRDVLTAFHKSPSKMSDKDLVKLLPYEDFEVPPDSQILHEEFTDVPMTLENSLPLENSNNIDQSTSEDTKTPSSSVENLPESVIPSPPDTLPQASISSSLPPSSADSAPSPPPSLAEPALPISSPIDSSEAPAKPKKKRKLFIPNKTYNLRNRK